MNDAMETSPTGGLGSNGGQAPLPLVTVIVPVFNGESTLPALLESLASQDYPRDRLQLLMADDASSDRSAPLLAAHRETVEVVRQPVNRGSYAARNAALSLARGEVLAFTDADCRPEAGWVSSGVRALQAQGSGLVAGAVAIEPVDRRSALQRYDQAFGIQQRFFALRQRFGATANLFVDRRALDVVPGFDERLRSGGDKAFCDACTAAGLPFSYAPQSRVRHAPRTSLRELVVKQARVARGHAQIFPRWSRYRIVPLSTMPGESFDHDAFRRDPDTLFRWRFRATYYGLEVVYLAAYVRSCLRLTIEGLFR